MDALRAFAAGAAGLFLLAGGLPARAEVRASGGPVAAAVASRLGGACGLGTTASVDVIERRGVVTLQGTVATLAQRECVAIAAEKTPGVRSLVPSVRVKPTRRLTDADLEELARAALRDEADLQAPARIEVRSASGRLTMSGTVVDPEDRYRAGDALRRIDGVLELHDALGVDAAEGLRALEADLRELFRVRRIAVDDLRLTLSRGRVLIEGRAHDVVARDLIETYVRDVPGGRRAVDRLRIVLRPEARPGGADADAP